MTYVVNVKASGRTSVETLFFVWTALATVPAAFDLSREACAIGLAAVVLGPLVLTWAKTRRLLVADPIIVLGVVWLLALTLPVLAPDLYKDRMWRDLSPWSLDTAALWMYRAWTACCLTYWGARLWFGKGNEKQVSAFDLLVKVQLRRWIGFSGIVGTLVYVIFMGGHTYQILEEAEVADSTTKQIILLFSELSVVYVYLYFNARGRSKLNKIDKYLLIGVLAAQAIIFLGSGSKYNMMALCAAYVLGNATAVARPGFLREIAISAVSVAAIFIISYVIAAYRGELVSRALPNADAPITEVLAFQYDVMVSALLDVAQGKQVGEGYYTDYDSSFIFDRFAHVAAFALVLETQNGIPPYENSYASLISPVFAVLPRALLPDKVHFMNSGDFAKLNGWTYGGLSITIPGSFFWAWGNAGIVLGMAGIGIAFAWLWSRTTGRDSSALIWRATMMFAVITLLDVGVSFQVFVIPTTRVLLLLLIMRWGIRGWARSARSY